MGAQMYRLPKCVQRDDELQVFVQDKVVGAVEGIFFSPVSLLDGRTKTKGPVSVGGSF